MSKTIAITGKGGVGKTVIAGLITKYLKERASGPILALDADPDGNLGTVLAIPVETTIGDLREDTIREIKDLPAGISKMRYIEAGLHQLVVESEKVDLLAMGRSEGPGCYCYINSLLRGFADELQDRYEWVVMDNEAGLEHLSRRTASNVDALIVVVSHDPLSVDCAKRIEKLVSQFRNDIRRKFVVTNKTSADRLETIISKIEELDMEYIGDIPPDEDLADAVFTGKSLFELNSSPAVSKINEIMSRIEES